jgi:hypothetical protein
VNLSRSSLGDTWRTRYGSRGGIQVRTPDGEIMRAVVRTTWSGEVGDAPADLGDKYSDATQENWEKSHWTEKKPVRTQADALVAARWFYLRGATEARSGYFNDLAAKCAYAYEASGLSAKNILKVVLNELQKGGAFRTAGKVNAVLAEFIRSAAHAAANPKQARRKPAPTRAPRLINLPEDKVQPIAPAEGWMEKARTYGPYVGGALAVALAVWALSPSRRQEVRVVGP